MQIPEAASLQEKCRAGGKAEAYARGLFKLTKWMKITVNKLAIITPYVALFGLVATVAVTLAKLWKTLRAESSGLILDSDESATHSLMIFAPASSVVVFV